MANALQEQAPGQEQLVARQSFSHRSGSFQELLHAISREHARLQARAGHLERQLQAVHSSSKERSASQVNQQRATKQEAPATLAADPQAPATLASDPKPARQEQAQESEGSEAAAPGGETASRQVPQPKAPSQRRSDHTDATGEQDQQPWGRLGSRLSSLTSRSRRTSSRRTTSSNSRLSFLPGFGGSSRFAVDDINDKPEETKRKFTSMSALFLPEAGPGSFMRRLVHSSIFEFASGLVIFAMAFLLGLETQYMARHSGTSAPVFSYVNTCMNFLFCSEFCLRALVGRLSFFTGQDWRWNVLDTVLVLCSTVDIVIALVAMVNVNFLMVGRILRLLRLFRLIRTVRLARTLRSVREFHKMMYAVISSLRTLVCSLLILTFVIYFFSVLFCQAAMEHKASTGEVSTDLDRLYGSVPKSFYTLFASACTGIDWDESFAPLAATHYLYRLAFVVYISFMLFGVSNVVTSVFVESAIMSAQHSKELIVQEKQHVKEVAVMHMREVFKQIDQDSSGEISSDEMEYFLTDPNLKSYVDALGISAENTRMLFRLMDMDESGKIDIHEFCDGCLRLQGEAKSMDVHSMIFQVRKFLAKWSEFTAYVEERFNQFEKELLRIREGEVRAI